jgi:hypothetical protein
MDLRERVIERVDNLFNYIGAGKVPGIPDLIANIVEVIVRDERAEAWDEGHLAGSIDWHDGKSDNPYRPDHMDHDCWCAKS